MSKFYDIIARHKQGAPVGLTSVCSAHPWVIEAALRFARDRNGEVLIEATSNQVDQTGGYTGMTPVDFRNFVLNMAEQIGLPQEQVILGGDHLGPNRWQHLPAEQAMQNAEVLVEHYVRAGFRKIHLDCSMACADDSAPLSDAIVARRAARLALKCEAARNENPGSELIGYVIGTEVPVPGGADHSLAGLELTAPGAAQQTLVAHQAAFSEAGLSHLWPQVLGLVVQPGVEFSHDDVVDFVPAKAAALSAFINDQPQLVYEAHSTDYQQPAAYRALVQQHFAILKVGPALTFALREALYGLEAIEQALLPAAECSQLQAVIEQVLLAKPGYWAKYYTGEESRQYLLRHYSYSDRIRYYWHEPAIARAVEQLLANLRQSEIPLPLISQHLPARYAAIRSGQITAEPQAMIIDHICDVLRVYQSGCE